MSQRPGLLARINYELMSAAAEHDLVSEKWWCMLHSAEHVQLFACKPKCGESLGIASLAWALDAKPK